jgi:cyclopropane-fatty-acyl-phospholipid synthase
MIRALSRRLVHALGRGVKIGTVHLVDGAERTTFGGKAGPLEVTVTVHDERFYEALALRGTIGWGEAYRDGFWSVDDLVTLVRICVQNSDLLDGIETGLARLAQPLQRVFHALRDNTRRGSRANIAAHYDLGNDFYSLFLDESMTYSCALFEHEGQSLAEAQLAKIDRICRKLRLEPGDHLLEIGTGWGALACHAARNYGCRVTTTTISKEQGAYARERVAREGLAERVTVLSEDYRDLKGKHDKLVSIEMIEAVGARWWPAFFGRLSELLEEDGLALIQSITIREDRYEASLREIDFVKRYIFPGCCLPTVAGIAERVGATDMALAHLEDLTPHYATTLRLWRERFLENKEKVLALGYDERFVRLWEFYLAYCEAGFEERYTRDVQVVLAKRLAPSEVPGASFDSTGSLVPRDPVSLRTSG